MIRAALAVLFVTFFLAACNSGYSDAMANAKIHACELEKVKKELETKKGDKGLEAKQKELVEFLKLDQDMSGDSIKFIRELSEFVKAGCK